MTSRSRLLRLLVKHSVRLGDFVLASGARSAYYIDARTTTMRGEGLALVGEVCGEAMRAAGWRPSHVGGLTLGADPVAYAMAAHATRAGGRLDAFTVRKARKSHGVGKQIEGGLPAGAEVVIVEDSVTSGGSALQAARAVAEHGCRILGVLALVDRAEGGRERLAGAGHELQAVFQASELLQAARANESSAAPPPFVPPTS